MTLFKLPEDDPKPEYWIMEFPEYGKFVYFGTETEASVYFGKKLNWEGGKGSIKLADPQNKEDRKLVIAEIQAVREDRASGIRDLPFLPSKGWF
jgi:hypothetical protein